MITYFFSGINYRISSLPLISIHTRQLTRPTLAPQNRDFARNVKLLRKCHYQIDVALCKARIELLMQSHERIRLLPMTLQIATLTNLTQLLANLMTKVKHPSPKPSKAYHSQICHSNSAFAFSIPMDRLTKQPWPKFALAKRILGGVHSS